MDKIMQAQKDGVVLGLKDVAGVVPRRDIDWLLSHEPDTFNLFLLALDELQNDPDSTKIMGYFQIAGIHGLPKTFWDGVQVLSKQPGSSDPSGYCAHGTIIFPTWHRPYLAMIEQTIYAKMTDIVERFPVSAKPKYQAAVQKFRLPYWDYFNPRGRKVVFPGVKLGGAKTSFDYDFSIPQIFTLEQVMIRTPEKDELTLKDNPLNFFRFPSKGSIPDREWSIMGLDASTFSRTRTTRYPTAQEPLKGDTATLNSTLNKQREPNTSYILNMISDPAYDVYSAFATDTAQTGSSGSLEGIHGNYHFLIGGTRGHMSRVPVAAFDPVFWMHHCQIDRWAAIWQAVHPDKWFSDDEQSLEEEDLLPFRVSKDPGSQDFWTSRSSRHLEPFGYTYPDVMIGSAQQVGDTFRKNYEWSVRTPTRPFGAPPADMMPLDLSKAQVYQFNTVPGPHKVPNFGLHTQKKMADVSGSKDTANSGPAVDKAMPMDDHSEPGRTTGVEKASDGQGKAFRNMPMAQVSHTANEAVDESKVSREWFVDDTVERLALNGAFTIYYFIGKFDNRPEDFVVEPCLAGVSHIFAAPTEACDNCGRQAEQAQLITNTSPITPMLLDYVEIGELQDLTPEQVKQFLVKRLKWRVVTINGELVDPRAVRGLKIGVSSKSTPAPPATGSPTYQEYPEIIEEIISHSS